MLRPGKPLQFHPPGRGPKPVPIPPAELDNPTAGTVLRLIRNTAAWVVRDPTALLLATGFLVLMLWGFQGRLDLLREFWHGWAPFTDAPEQRARIIPGIAWDQEWISYWAGAVLLVGLPALLIKFGFKQDLADYGLGLPREGRWQLTIVSTVLLFGVSLPTFLLGSRHPGMVATYPLFRGCLRDNSQFFLYELGYFPFFLAIEFIFRGFLLFGLYRIWRELPGPESLRDVPHGFGYYAVLISMLSYTAWHLGKPVPETWGTLVWGLATGTIALATGTIWPIIGVHWVLNVLLDFAIWHRNVSGHC